jgi:hypothetical protein
LNAVDVVRCHILRGHRRELPLFNGAIGFEHRRDVGRVDFGRLGGDGWWNGRWRRW